MHSLSPSKEGLVCVHVIMCAGGVACVHISWESWPMYMSGGVACVYVSLSTGGVACLSEGGMACVHVSVSTGGVACVHVSQKH